MKVWIPYVFIELLDDPVDLNDPNPGVISLGIFSSPEKAKKLIKRYASDLEFAPQQTVPDSYADEKGTVRDYIEVRFEGPRKSSDGQARLFYAAIISVVVDEEPFTGPPDSLTKAAWIAGIISTKDERT